MDLFAQDHLQQKRLYRKDLWLLLPRRVRIKSVEVLPLAVTPEVPIDHAVRVYDRNDVEGKVLQENFSFGAIRKQVVNEAVADMARGHFSWMYSRTDKNALNRSSVTLFPIKVKHS